MFAIRTEHQKTEKRPFQEYTYVSLHGTFRSECFMDLHVHVMKIKYLVAKLRECSWVDADLLGIRAASILRNYLRVDAELITGRCLPTNWCQNPDDPKRKRVVVLQVSFK
jgi:hypothetical protein